MQHQSNESENCLHGNSGLPFSHLNLWRNPFGEFTVAERTAIAIVDCGQAVRHLNQDRAVVQVIGEKGFGKTTHLLSIATYFSANAYVHIPERQRVAIPASGEPLLIDEAQRLTILQRWQCFRSQRRLILGTHSNFEAQLRRAGRPVLTVAADQFTNETLVHKLLNARIEFSRRNTGSIPSITIETARKLFKQFGSDIRSMEHTMYSIFQQLRDIRDV
jgi:hypothetical protein